jgi:hypothetical protein
MEEKNVTMAIKLSIVAAILLISFSVFYYFVIFLPSIQRGKSETERKKTESLSAIRSDCQQWAVSNAVEFYKSRSKENEYLYRPGEGMYLRPDYEAYYKDCLRSSGIEEK